ncbi:kinase domain-containing protein, partial [Hypoxylon argillaceum]
MELLPFQGTTSVFFRVKEGIVLKSPRTISTESQNYEQLTNRIALEFHVEREILELLGSNPRIVKYHGWHKDTEGRQGLLLAKADETLEDYLQKGDVITPSERKTLCRQTIQSIVYAHENGVIHSDLRPENILVSGGNIWLSDFGGSTCEKRGLDGGHLPDSGFWNPNSKWESTPATDIFSLGSILYTIVTGHWPYKDGTTFKTLDEYRQYVDERFKDGQFPSVADLVAGEIIMGCWMGRYETADDILRDFDLEIG